MTTTVKVSSRNQIVVPRQAREQLKIKPGDRLIVDVQGSLIVLSPEPDDYVEYMAGLGREVWKA
jgi:AbrB family looped-hinge helix DNA binding protein